MALPLLTWDQTAWVVVGATDHTTYLDAIAAVFAASSTWELAETSTYWRSFKPTAGSAIPDARILVFYGNGLAVPHATALGARTSSASNLMAFVGISPDAGATAAGDPTVGVPYAGRRWIGFHSFDKPATRVTNQMYGVLSEEAVALFVQKSSVDTSWGSFVVGALGVAHVDDSEADERLWMVYGSGGSGGADIVTTWAASSPTAAAAFLSSYSAPSATYNQLYLADPGSPSTVRYCHKQQQLPQVDANTLVSTSGRTIVLPLNFTIESTPKRHGGHLRQMGVGPSAVCRTILQDATLADKGIVFAPSLVTAYPCLVFTADAI